MVGAALVVSACVGLLFTPLTTVQADDTKIIKITMGKAEVVPVMGAVADIMVADPKIADVSALQSNKLYIVGASIGDTNIIALDSEGNVVQKLDVHVRIDTDIIEDMIHTVFPSEKNVMVHTVGNQVALTGTVSNPSTAQKIAKLVAAHMGEVRKSSAAKTLWRFVASSKSPFASVSWKYHAIF